MLTQVKTRSEIIIFDYFLLEGHNGSKIVNTNNSYNYYTTISMNLICLYTMLHPNPDIQKRQEEFLKNCSDKEREFQAKLFRVGNAIYIYNTLAASTEEKKLAEYFNEWLETLPLPISEDMRKKGFEACKTAFPFTRYVNERNDVGLDEWLKENLSAEDYEFYNQH